MLRFLCPMRRGWWFLLLIAVLLLPASVQAQSKSLFWERYDVDITVSAYQKAKISKKKKKKKGKESPEKSVAKKGAPVYGPEASE